MAKLHHLHQLLLFLLSFLLMVYSTSRADPIKTFKPFCLNGTIAETRNSTFEANGKLLLSSLPSNTSLYAGFYNTTVGDDSFKVYGLALCRGDVNATVCKNCVETASQEIIKQCPDTEDETIVYEFCQLRYSTQRFFSRMVYFGRYQSWNGQEQKVVDPDQFKFILSELMNNLTQQAVSDPSNRLFATDDAVVKGHNKVYGLVQCTRDISKVDCASCLRNAIGDIEFYSSYQGGAMISTSCNLRYELYPFYRESTTAVTGNGRMVVIVTSVSVSVLVLLLMVCCVCYLWVRKGTQGGDGENGQNSLLHDLGAPTSTLFTGRNMQEENQVDSHELTLMELATIKVATDNFSDSNKLGQGGFGTVYKGTLPDGMDIAVKRLSWRSWQGSKEFKNEVILIAKLQHRNLVRLLGCGIEEEERLLIYEFMPNTSLDVFIFDQTRRSQLDWSTRLKIIGGIARGLLYLHEDSRLKIIHRDLKPSNVLLDHEMNAKISDFGMARIFGENQSAANTRRVVGTYGYMAPEYAMEGLFSVKSDVFSFGVILLEIMSGQKNSGFYLTEHAQTLIGYAWKLWIEGRGLDLVDPVLIRSSSKTELLRCIHIGLLCVQEDAADRPIMSSVVVLLRSKSIILPQPTKPAFSVERVVVEADQSSTVMCTANLNTVSSVSPR